MGGHRREDRGVSEVVGYLLSVAIVGMVMVGVVVSASAYFEQREEVAVSTDLEEHGQHLSRTVGIVDRLVRQSNSSGEIGRQVDLPSTVGDERYRITIVNRTRASAPDSPCNRPCLVLATDDVTRRVYVASVTTLEAGSVVGGSLYVVRPAAGDRLHVRGGD